MPSAPTDALCSYCLAPAQAWDHVEPRRTGGTDRPDNLVPACHPCNISKGAEPLVLFLLRRRYGRKRTAVVAASSATQRARPRTSRDELVCRLWNDGATPSDIARATAIHVQTVTRLLRENGRMPALKHTVSVALE